LAPAGHECTRDRDIPEVDGDRIIDDAPDPAGVIAQQSAPAF